MIVEKKNSSIFHKMVFCYINLINAWVKKQLNLINYHATSEIFSHVSKIYLNSNKCNKKKY